MFGSFFFSLFFLVTQLHCVVQKDQFVLSVQLLRNNVVVASRFLAITSKTTINIWVRFLCGLTFSAPLGKYLSAIAGSYDQTMCNFARNKTLSSKVDVPFSIPSRNEWEFLLLCNLTSIWYCHFFFFFLDNSYSNRCVVIAKHCCLNLYFPDDMMWSITSYALYIAICTSSLEKCQFRTLTQFLTKCLRVKF